MDRAALAEMSVQMASSFTGPWTNDSLYWERDQTQPRTIFPGLTHKLNNVSWFDVSGRHELHMADTAYDLFVRCRFAADSSVNLSRSVGIVGGAAPAEMAPIDSSSITPDTWVWVHAGSIGNKALIRAADEAGGAGLSSAALDGGGNAAATWRLFDTGGQWKRNVSIDCSAAIPVILKPQPTDAAACEGFQCAARDGWLAESEAMAEYVRARAAAQHGERACASAFSTRGSACICF